MRNWTKWLKVAGVRAIKTVAQTAVAMVGVSAVMSGYLVTTYKRGGFA